MKRKLIETVNNEHLVVCDTPNCNYKVSISEANKDNLFSYVGVPCPKCGESLCTYEDYKTYMNLQKSISWLNKYFSWICYLVPKRIWDKRKIVSVHAHKGIKIT